ncbi:hypothetical protein JRI60_10305 [Archangium violaceum]|uniref:anti-sigma factor family protein n=1 Tax=Archangium violaceum TaxID=83451 RepID=UPI00194E6E91|nr:hypothetical protein [Archangium violaceum]QRN99376.1 hypothetical protein JRI60_10305 [Archangium violaceum]
MNPPDFGALRTGRPDCPSDFTLDRLHAGELPKEDTLKAERHVAGCVECGARMTERRAGFGAIEGVDPRVMLARIRTGLDKPAPLPERLLGWLRQRSAPFAAAAAAAVVLLVVSTQQVRPPENRAKGSLALHVFRFAGDHSEETVSGGAFKPGDRLRFVVDLPAEGHVTVLGVESSGALYTAWPFEPGVQTRFAEGTGIALPGAVSLDEKPGRETLYLVHCPVEVGPPNCTSQGAIAAPVCPAGCVTTPFILVKAP